ncbi:MAG: glycosyltransferase [Anaerolineae bacterium]|nr:glycosyltransferase [Anaerolineae bacterium]
MIVLWMLALGALMVILIIMLINSLTFPRLSTAPTPTNIPLVSLMVPARDEANVIGETVRHLLAQDYENIELLVLDDGSKDGTQDAARLAAGDDVRFRIMSGSSLPVGWTGKNWACHQLAGQARGDVLVFTDAGVRWETGALTALIGLMQHHAAGMMAIWPTQVMVTWPERLVVSLLMMVIMGYLPEIAVRLAPYSSLAAAIGQCIALRRPVYDAVGGHSAARAEIIEDVVLARLVKCHGHRLVMALGSHQISTRMYTSWAEVRDGFAKNIIAGHGGRLGLIASAFFHWVIFLLPWLWLAIGWGMPLGPGWPWFPLLLVALGIGVRAFSAALAQQPVSDALLIPISTFLMTIIACHALVWHFRGGVRWKGRILEHS